jgi:hypothetical protein
LWGWFLGGCFDRFLFSSYEVIFKVKMDWKVSFNSLKEYGLDDPYPTWWVGSAIKHKIDPVAILSILAGFVIILASLAPKIFIFNSTLSLVGFFIEIFTIYIFLSLAHSRVLIELFKIENLLKDDEFVKENKSSTWTPKRLALIGCVLTSHQKLEKTDLSEKVGISKRWVGKYEQEDLIKREMGGYVISPIKFDINGFKKSKGFFSYRSSKKDVEKRLLDLFKLRCIFQYNFIMKRKSKNHTSKNGKYSSKK